MTELLFKLKKDGKVVGYEQAVLQELLSNTKWAYNAMITQQRFPDGKWFDVLIGQCHFKPILHDEKCPFVTTDKNGKNVFAGDETNHGVLAWNSEKFAWTLLENVTDVLGEGNKIGIISMLSDYKDDIELIEDKDE